MNWIVIGASSRAPFRQHSANVAAVLLVAVGASALLAGHAQARIRVVTCSGFQSYLSVSPTTVVAGTNVTASGSCFNPNDSITFRLDSLTGSQLATSATDSSGAFANVNVPIPGATGAGSHTIFAVDSFGDNATSSVTVTAPVSTPTPTATATPTQTPVGSGGGTSTPTATATPSGNGNSFGYRTYLPAIFDEYANTIYLIANPGLGDVTEVNRAGQIVWSISGLNQPYRAERLANGNTLITEYGANRVIEVTRNAQIVWTYSVPLPVAAHRLANGNTLITAGTDANTSVVEEVAPDLHVIWSYNYSSYCVQTHQQNTFCQGYPSDAIRLANGNTLLAVRDSGVGLLEVNPTGATMLQRPVTGVDGVAKPLASVHELEDGNWLITTIQDLGARVVEQTAIGTDVCSYGSNDYSSGALYLPMDAWRTTGGTTLIADQGKDRILEVDCASNIIWQYVRKGAQPGSVEEVASSGN